MPESAHTRVEGQMARSLLKIGEFDEIKFSFIHAESGEEHTTQQKVVDIVTRADGIEVYCEESPGWNGPCANLVVYKHDQPSMKPEVKHPSRAPTPVEEFTEFEIVSEQHELEGACVDCGQVEVLNDEGYCPICVEADPELTEEIVAFLEDRADENGVYEMFWSLDKAYDRFDGSLEERMKERGQR